MFKRILTFIIVLAMAMTFTGGAFAATANPGPTLPGHQLLFIPINNISAAGTLTAMHKFTIPYPYKIVSVTTAARASTGTTPTLTIDIKSGSTSMLSTPCAVVAATVTQCSLSTTNTTLADESTITIDSVAGGTTPTFTDITLVVAIKRQ